MKVRKLRREQKKAWLQRATPDTKRFGEMAANSRGQNRRGWVFGVIACFACDNRFWAKPGAAARVKLSRKLVELRGIYGVEIWKIGR